MKYPHTYILIPYTVDRIGRVADTLASITMHTENELTPHSIVLYPNDYIGYPNAILDMVEGIDGFVFMGASDIILGEDWLKILWERMWQYSPSQQRTMAIEPFGEIQNGALCQHPLTHTDVVKKFFHRHYFHFYCDNEMTERLMAYGGFVYEPKAPMQHNHVFNGKAKMDEGYKVVMDPVRNEKDRQMYMQRKANGWPL